MPPRIKYWVPSINIQKSHYGDGQLRPKHVAAKQYILVQTNIHAIKRTNALMLKLYILHTICHNSNIFQSILIFFRELLNIYQASRKSIAGLSNTLFVHKMFVYITTFVRSSVELVHKIYLVYLIIHLLFIYFFYVQ